MLGVINHAFWVEVTCVSNVIGSEYSHTFVPLLGMSDTYSQLTVYLTRGLPFWTWRRTRLSYLQELLVVWVYYITSILEAIVHIKFQSAPWQK